MPSIWGENVMGGSGGGRGLSNESIRKLEEIAKTALREAARPGRRNVFISFAAEDVDEVNLLRAQARNDNSEIEFNDWSLREPFDSDRADYIRRGIRERIRQSSVTVVYVSANTTKSTWVDWEVRESLKLGKKVVAVHKGEDAPSHLPGAVTEHRLPVIPWSRLADHLKEPD